MIVLNERNIQKRTYRKYMCYAYALICVQLFSTPWTVAHQTPLSMEFSRQEYWSRLPFTSQGDFPDPGTESKSLEFPALAGRFFTIAPSGKTQNVYMFTYNLGMYPKSAHIQTKILHLWEKIFVKDVSDKRLAAKNIQRMFQNSTVKKKNKKVNMGQTCWPWTWPKDLSPHQI